MATCSCRLLTRRVTGSHGDSQPAGFILPYHVTAAQVRFACPTGGISPGNRLHVISGSALNQSWAWKFPQWKLTDHLKACPFGSCCLQLGQLPGLQALASSTLSVTLHWSSGGGALPQSRLWLYKPVLLSELTFQGLTALGADISFTHLWEYLFEIQGSVWGCIQSSSVISGDGGEEPPARRDWQIR